jgi:toxin-antitoxin system PIN domain toxin
MSSAPSRAPRRVRPAVVREVMVDDAHDAITRTHANASGYLLDVHVVLALLDPQHVFHDAAHAWAARERDGWWYTCPLVQHGVLRVASQPRYPNSLGTVEAVRRVLARFTASARHRFLADDVSLLDADRVADPTRLTPAHLTDLHLLALAARHGLRLATFDRRVPAAAIVGGAQALHVIMG